MEKVGDLGRELSNMVYECSPEFCCKRFLKTIQEPILESSSDGVKHMVVSQNKGTPYIDPEYYSPYYWDPKMVPPNFGKP